MSLQFSASEGDEMVKVTSKQLFDDPDFARVMKKLGIKRDGLLTLTVKVGVMSLVVITGEWIATTTEVDTNGESS